MGQISRQLSVRFRSRAFQKAAQQFRKPVAIPKDVKDIAQLVKDGYDPLHAVYISCQNIMSLFAEAVTALKELKPYTRIVGEAEDEYLPSGPPMSPLTPSHFTLWAFFDVRFGPDLETLGTCFLETGSDLGVNEGMLTITKSFQESRMGIYEHVGQAGGRVRLKELLTDEEFACHSPAGYVGKQGELWYVRRCPPLFDALDYHVLMTTPYVLLNASKADWMAYLKKQVLGQRDVRKALHAFLKYGSSPNHWNEFVFQGYHHHQRDAIFLTGLPDVRDSLPHASKRRLH